MNAAGRAATRFFGLAGWLGLALATGATGGATGEREHNAWPIEVRQFDANGNLSTHTAAGPFLFRRNVEAKGTASGFRPFWIQAHDADGVFRSGSILHPLFTYRADDDYYRWNILQLVHRSNHRPGAGEPADTSAPSGDFDVWPFWFSRQTGDPERDYRGFFPIAGEIKRRLWFDRLSWGLFPLYVRSEKAGVITTQTPWPILRLTRGEAHGFGVWPLFNWRERPGVSREEYYLWPLGYNITRQPTADDPPGTAPRRAVGALPLFARSTGPDHVNLDFAWPFFGYTRRTAPVPYRETRYFWPFLVQGRGDERWINRWGPFYTHSVVKGVDKRWFAWPLVRLARWSEGGLDHSRSQFLYFLHWSHVQRSTARPDLAPAVLRHVWPFFSGWDNGAGRRQWQAPSPLEVFLPGNEMVRETWSPFFTWFRYEQKAPGETRAALLWNAVTWRRSDADGRSEFHLGPLFSRETDRGARRIAIANGLLGWKRGTPDGRWRFFWRDFSKRRPQAP